VQYRTTPPQKKQKKKTPEPKKLKTPESKKAKKTPETRKKSAEETRMKNKEKYLSNLAAEGPTINNNLDPNHPKNLIDTMNKIKCGSINSVVFTENSISPVINNLSLFKVWLSQTPFQRRITSLAWHPTKPGLACVGNKGGELVLWNVHKHLFSDAEPETEAGPFEGRITGRGPGGSIQSLKFDEISPSKVYTASIEGIVSLRDFEGRGDKVFLETKDWTIWYTGLDVNFEGKSIVAGRSNGDVTLLTLEGEEMWTKRLHKSKCNFVQFNHREPWLMVTSSTDSEVKIWDIRSIRDKSSALAELVHEKAVNSAYFSTSRGDKLLTTDQHSQIRVYQGPYWDLKKTIVHPHRQFQHLSPIKACWHPLIDIPFAGRYPDPALPDYVENELRSIDFFNPESGSPLLKLHQPGLDKIISLSQFNPTGDYLLSGMNSTILVWKQGPNQEEEEEKNEDEEEREKGQQKTNSSFWPEFGKKTKKPREKKEKKN